MTEANIEPNPEAKPSLKHRVLRQVRNLAIGYGVVVVMLAFFQRKLIYVPSTATEILASRSIRAGDHPQRIVDIVTPTDDGIQLHGWHCRSGDIESHDAADGRFVVLFFHGNGGHRAHRASDLDLMNSLGADTVIFDYRGYGENEGKPTEEGLTLDAEAAWKFATTQLNVDPSRMILFGESLGGGVSIRLASQLCQNGTTPGGLIVRSSFSSLTDAASFHYPWLPVKTVLVDRFPSVDRIPNVDCPILSIHGDADSIVPFEQGQALFNAAPDTSDNGLAKRFETIHGANHNDVLHVGGREVQSVINEFLTSIRQTMDAQSFGDTAATKPDDNEDGQ